jgi:hypothetical protein
MVSQVEQEVTVGLTVNVTMDNGSMDLNMVPECGEASRETLIKVNGDLESLKVMEFILGQAETPMRVNSSNV